MRKKKKQRRNPLSALCSTKKVKKYSKTELKTKKLAKILKKAPTASALCSLLNQKIGKIHKKLVENQKFSKDIKKKSTDGIRSPLSAQPVHASFQ